MAFRLTSPEANEQSLLDQIVDYLRYQQMRDRVIWFARVNGGGMKDRTGRFLKFYRLYLKRKEGRSTGMADLHGMLRGGRYFALEVKRPSERPTPDQIEFLESVRAGGGIGAVVRSYTEVPSLLFGERESG